MELTLDQALEKGIEAHKAGKAYEADQYYTAVLNAQPKHPDANHNMGVLAVGVGKVQEAIPFFTAALEANPTITQYWLSYIDALIKLDRIEDAKSAFDRAKSNGAQGVVLDKLQRQLRMMEKGKVVNAASQKPKEPSQRQVQLVITLYKQGQYQEALQKATKLLKEFPYSTKLYNIMGLANKGLGKLEQAIEAYHTAIVIKPDFAEAYTNLGNALQEQDNLDKAIAAYNKAVTIKPDNFKAYYNMGNALKEHGKLEKAITAYNKALSFKPDFAEAYNNMGIALKGQGKLEEAIEAHNKAISVSPNYAEAYNNIGGALQEKGSLNEAIEAYDKALSIKPDYAVAYWNRASTVDNISEAKNWLTKCLNANPNFLEAKLTIIALQYYEGDTSNFNQLTISSLKDHPYTRSFAWAFGLPTLPKLYFHRWALFDHIISLSKKDRPFYEFGVWRGEAFKYLIKTIKKGYGFDTFKGLPENWHHEPIGSYSSDGKVPRIKGGEFIVGKFEDTLPSFFAERRPMASIINFDADLYSSTITALNHSKPVIDKHTILVFDEFIINKNWEQDEYKALEEFCANNHYTYEVVAISFATKQVAVKILGV